jgi:hypothetical protein
VNAADVALHDIQANGDGRRVEVGHESHRMSETRPRGADKRRSVG